MHAWNTSQYSLLTPFDFFLNSAASDSTDQLATGNAPQFVRLMTDVLVDEGEDTTFECQVIGEPRPDVRWRFNNIEIDVFNDRTKARKQFILIHYHQHLL